MSDTAKPQASAADLGRELEAKLERFEELKPQHAEFEKLKKELKPIFDGTPEITIGAFQITGQEQKRDGYFVKGYRFWDWKVARVVPASVANV